MAEEARLESVYRPKAYRGFESRSLRKEKGMRTPGFVIAQRFRSAAEKESRSLRKTLKIENHNWILQAYKPAGFFVVPQNAKIIIEDISK